MQQNVFRDMDEDKKWKVDLLISRSNVYELKML